MQAAGTENAALTNGDAAFVSGNYDKAESCANQAAKIHLNPIEDIALLGRTYLAEHRNEQAVALLEYVCDDKNSFAPRDLLPYSLALLRTGQYDRAVAAYNKALPWIALGEVLEEYGAFKTTPRRPVDLEMCIHIGLGLQYYDERNGNTAAEFKRVMDEYARALALNPISPMAMLYYGIGLKIIGKSKEADAFLAETAEVSSGRIKDMAVHPIY